MYTVDARIRMRSCRKIKYLNQKSDRLSNWHVFKLTTVFVTNRKSRLIITVCYGMGRIFTILKFHSNSRIQKIGPKVRIPRGLLYLVFIPMMMYFLQLSETWRSRRELREVSFTCNALNFIAELKYSKLRLLKVLSWHPSTCSNLIIDCCWLI